MKLQRVFNEIYETYSAGDVAINKFRAFKKKHKLQRLEKKMPKYIYRYQVGCAKDLLHNQEAMDFLGENYQEQIRRWDELNNLRFETGDTLSEGGWVADNLYRSLCTLKKETEETVCITLDLFDGVWGQFEHTITGVENSTAEELIAIAYALDQLYDSIRTELNVKDFLWLECGKPRPKQKFEELLQRFSKKSLDEAVQEYRSNWKGDEN